MAVEYQAAGKDDFCHLLSMQRLGKMKPIYAVQMVSRMKGNVVSPFV